MPDEVAVIYQANLKELEKDQKKLIKSVEDTEKAVKKTDKTITDTAKKRQFLIDAEIKRTAKLRKQRDAAFNPSRIRVFNERIQQSQNNIKTLQGNFDNLEKKTKGFGDTIKKVGIAVGVAFGVRALFRFGKEFIKLADIQAKAEQRLLTALKGREDVQQALLKQAKEFQGITIFSDEDVIAAQSLIAAFTEEEEQIKSLTRVTLDFATAKGFDLPAAAELVSKTFASSTNSLTRYGIQVEGAAGSSERLESIITNLDNAFLGQAESATTGAGKMQQMSNALNDAKEKAGLFLITALEPMSELIKDLAEGFGRAITPTNQLSTAIAKSRVQFNLEVQILKESNLSQELKNEILQGLNRTYKPYLDNLGIEEINLENIAEVAVKVNKELEKKFIIQLREEETNAILEEGARLRVDEIRTVGLLTSAQNTLNAVREVGGKDLTQEIKNVDLLNDELEENRNRQQELKEELIEVDSVFKQLLKTTESFTGPIMEVIDFTNQETISISLLKEQLKAATSVRDKAEISSKEFAKAQSDIVKLEAQIAIATGKRTKSQIEATRVEKQAAKDSEEALKNREARLKSLQKTIETFDKAQKDFLDLQEDLTRVLREGTIETLKRDAALQQVILKEQLAAQEITEEEFADKSLDIKKALVVQLKALDEDVFSTELGFREDAADKTLELNKEQIEAQKEAVATFISTIQVAFDIIDRLIQNSISELNRIEDEKLEELEDTINAENELRESQRDLEIEELEKQKENGIITQKELTKRKKLINDAFNKSEKNALDKNEKEKIKIQKKAEEERIKLQRNAAIAKKLASVFEIGINTAIGATAALLIPPPAGEILAAARIIFGATQLALALAEPMPQFAKGTKGTGEGMAIVGEKGAELVYTPKGTKILPAAQTKLHSEVIDAMYDNRLPEFIQKNYISPAVQGATYDDYRLFKATKNNNSVNIKNFEELSELMSDIKKPTQWRSGDSH